MIHLLWNCCGLGSDTVVRALHGLIRKYRPSMIILFEIKMKDHRIEGVRKRMRYSKGFNVSPIRRAGCLSMWRDDFLEVEVGFSLKHIIDARIRMMGSENWVQVTWVYGTFYQAEKAEFWRWMNTWFGPSNIP